MTSQIEDTYNSPVKNAIPQNGSTTKTSKTTATTLSEHSGYKEGIKLKIHQSDSKSGIPYVAKE